MTQDDNGLMTFSQRVKMKESVRHGKTLAELEEENALLRAKYTKALLLLRQYKSRAELALKGKDDFSENIFPEPIEAGPIGKEKVTNMWRERLLRMNSISPRKERTVEPARDQKPIEVLELAEALNSGEIRLEPSTNQVEDSFEDISELLSFRS
jgi:hypothetical protein